MKKLDLPPPPLSETDIPLPPLTIKKPEPIAEKVVEPVPAIQEPVDLEVPEPEEVTCSGLLEALREHHQIVLNKFDQIYFKVEQLQNMILEDRKKKK